MREDGNVHPADRDRPSLKDRDRRYYDAFRSLSSARTWSQVGPNPLQISEIAAYLGLLGLEDPDTRMKYVRLLQGLDLVEMKSIRAKTKAG